MKRILVMRHAKSDWGAQYHSDSERPLNARGQRDGPLMAAFLNAHKSLPEIIISSPAQRAQSTAAFVAQERAFGGELRLDDRVYLASASMLMEVVQGLPDAVSMALLVGHNPSMEDLVELLCGGRVRMPTAAIASMQVFVPSWSEVRAGAATLQWLVRPKLLRK